MYKWLKRRASEPEYMDDFTSGGAELQEALKHLRRLNVIFGAAGPVLYGVRKLWADAGRPRRLTILDVGAGSGEINRKLLRWADVNRVEIRIRLADITEEACAEAREVYRGEPRVSVSKTDLFELQEASADIVTASQFVHHFDHVQLPMVVQAMLKASRTGIVVSDIHRHWLSWAAVWLATRCVSKNRYIRHDGPLSVAKGFNADDWRELREALLPATLSYCWRPLFRYAVMIPKGAEILSRNQRS